MGKIMLWDFIINKLLELFLKLPGVPDGNEEEGATW